MYIRKRVGVKRRQRKERGKSEEKSEDTQAMVIGDIGLLSGPSSYTTELRTQHQSTRIGNKGGRGGFHSRLASGLTF